MGKSAIERINSIGEAPAQKSFNGGGLSSYYLSSATNTPNLRADEWGAATAYGINVAVAAGMNVWETWLEGLKWEIREKNTDRVLASSDMRDKPSGIGANFWQAVKAHRQYTKHSFFRSIAFSDMLYGETYVHLVSNGLWGIGGLEWLNPLAVEPMIMRGKIEYYNYSGDEGSLQIPPHCVAYRILRRNAFDDLRGQSKVLTAIMAVNLETNTKQGVLSYFKNAMMLGGIASPVSEDVNLSPTQIAEREAAWERRYKGVGNAGRIMLAPTKLNLEFFPAPDIEKNYSVIQPLRNEILMAMDVPPQLANDPSQVTYDNADAVVRIWRDMHGIPYATDAESFINSDILPRLEPSTLCYFAFDFSKFEVEKPEVVAADVSAGFIDLYEAAKLRGYTPDENLKGIYWPAQSQQPLHRDILVQLSRTLPSQVQLDLAQADKATSEAESIQVEPAPLAPMASLEAPAIVDTVPIEDDSELSELPSLEDDLKKWRKKAENSFRKGMARKALDFESDVIPELLKEALCGVIGSAKSLEEINRAFADARHYDESFHTHA